jgi:transcriptional regulator with XRE-family HTH domain
VINISLGDRIRQLRESLDISLRELAKKLEVSPPFLSDVELGRRFPSDEHLVKLAKELKTTLDDLKKYDLRQPVAEIKRLSENTPAVGFAFRTMLEKVKEGATPEEIIRKLNQIK